MEGSESGPEEQHSPALYSYEPAKLTEGMPAGDAMRTSSSEEQAVCRGRHSAFAPVDLIADCCTWGIFVYSVRCQMILSVHQIYIRKSNKDNLDAIACPHGIGLSKYSTPFNSTGINLC